MTTSDTSDGCLPNRGRRDQRASRCETLGEWGQLEKIWSDGVAEVHQIVVGPMDNNVDAIRCKEVG